MTGCEIDWDRWVDRQVAEDDEVFLDHVGYFVSDLQQAGDALERLGFQVSAVNVQYNQDEDGELTPSGTSNRLVRLRRGFIEVLAATHDTALADQLRHALARYQGLHLLALSHADLARQSQRLTSGGLAMQPLVNMKREVATPDGPGEVSWSILRSKPGEMKEGRIQFVTAHTPELSWPQGSTVHPNAADGLTDVLICVEDPLETADRYGIYAGRRPVELANCRCVSLDRGRIWFVRHDAAASYLPGGIIPDPPFIAGYALRSADLEQTRRALDDGGVLPAHADDDLICVGANEAFTSFLLFHRPSVAVPWRMLADRISAA